MEVELVLIAEDEVSGPLVVIGPLVVTLVDEDEALDEVELDDDDLPIEASTISVVYVDFDRNSTVVVKVTVLPGPHGSGLYSATDDEYVVLCTTDRLGRLAEALIIWRLSRGGGSIAKDRFFLSSTPIMPSYEQESLGPPADTIARSTQPLFIQNGNWK